MPWFAIFPLTAFGLFMLIHPIGMIRLVVILIAGLVASTAHVKYPKLSLGIGLTIFLTYLTDLLAWYKSKEAIAPEQATMMWGPWPSAYRAGFPLHQLELPPPPLGPGEGLLLNHIAATIPNLIFWLAVSAVVVTMAFVVTAPVLKRFVLKQNRIWALLVLGAFFLNVQFMGLYMIWFD